MKKLLSILMCFVLIVSTLTFVSIPVSADEEYYYEGAFEYYLNEDGTATIGDYYDSESNIVIPSTLGGYPVTSIGNSAFGFCLSLTSITIPDSVTSIGDYAFNDCSFLTSITIPNSVTSIGYGAFRDCSSLTSITIPNSVTSIGYWAFRDCSSLTSITIPNSVTSIGYDAFYGTTHYNDSKNWENDVLYIGNHLIKAKTSLSGNYSIKEGTKTIANSAFYNCSSLTSITIPNSVTIIGDDAFYNCSSLTSVTIPNSVTSIGEDAFEYCSSLTGVNITDLKSWCEIEFADYYANPLCYADKLYLNGNLVVDLVIPQGITKINAYAFNSCVALTSITIPDSVTSIGDYAFYDCSSLKTITIPDSVTSVGEDAFEYYYLTDLIIAEGSTKITKAMVVSKYLYSVTIPGSVTKIEKDAFYKCEDLTSVYIPSSVTEIGEHAVGYYDSDEFFGQGYDLIEDFVIYGEKGSTAEKYAKENGIKFITEHKTTILKGKKNATYFADGYTGDNVCSRCGEVILKGSATSKLTLKVPTFKLTKGKKQFKVKYTAVADATGFQVRYKLKGKWKTKTFATKKTVTKAIKKLKKGTYQVQVRAMIKQGKQKVYSAWSKTKKVKVK